MKKTKKVLCALIALTTCSVVGVKIANANTTMCYPNTWYEYTNEIVSSHTPDQNAVSIKLNKSSSDNTSCYTINDINDSSDAQNFGSPITLQPGQSVKLGIGSSVIHATHNSTQSAPHVQVGLDIYNGINLNIYTAEIHGYPTNMGYDATHASTNYDFIKNGQSITVKNK